MQQNRWSARSLCSHI